MATYGTTKGAKTLEKSAESGIIKINSPISNRESYKGRPTAIYTLDVELSKRQQRILDSLAEYDSQQIFKKDDVSMVDLSALTAKTGMEFAMFTRGSQRLVIRGGANHVNVDIKKAKNLANMGYKFSGHTHPGGDYSCLIASGNDYEILKIFGQTKSVTYNSKGHYLTYELEG